MTPKPLLLFLEHQESLLLMGHGLSHRPLMLPGMAGPSDLGCWALLGAGPCLRGDPEARPPAGFVVTSFLCCPQPNTQRGSTGCRASGTVASDGPGLGLKWLFSVPIEASALVPCPHCCSEGPPSHVHVYSSLLRKPCPGVSVSPALGSRGHTLKACWWWPARVEAGCTHFTDEAGGAGLWVPF